MAHMLQQETKLVHPAKCPYSTSKIACSLSTVSQKFGF
jgi:hypothetical protein